MLRDSAETGKRKKPNLFESRFYTRFLLSFVLVLMLPIFVYSLVNEQYFVRLYRNEVLEQFSAVLDRQAQQLDAQIAQCASIAGQISLQTGMRSGKLASSTSYLNVRSVLAGTLATQPFFESIAFYSPATPTTVYSDSGTYNTRYFCRYAGDGIFSELSANAMAKRGWVLPSETRFNPAVVGRWTLQYLQPVPNEDRSLLIFFIREKSIASVLWEQDSFSLLYDADGRVLYPASVPEEYRAIADELSKGPQESFIDKGKHMIIQRVSEVSKVRLARILPREAMLSKVSELQRVSTMILMLLLLVGGFTAYLVAFFNYQPIRKLGEYAEDVVGIPGELDDIRKARLALERMDQWVASLKESQLREQLVLRLIHGKGYDSAEFQSACRVAGLRLNKPFLRVALLSLGDAYHAADALLPSLRKALGDGWIADIEYPKTGSYLALIGAADSRSDGIRSAFSESLAAIPPDRADKVRIAVGGGCKKAFEAHRSYMQALMVGQMEPRLFHDGVLFF